jgi:hypothetical protein
LWPLWGLGYQAQRQQFEQRVVGILELPCDFKMSDAVLRGKPKNSPKFQQTFWRATSGGLMLCRMQTSFNKLKRAGADHQINDLVTF